MSFRNCAEVTAACPIQATTYGYYPNLGLNAALLACFATVCIVQSILAPLTRVYSYSIVIAFACFGEALGYAGRIIMHSNPWNRTGMRLQIHVIRFYGSEYSRLRPELFTWVFIGCDIASILLQAVGGGIASSGGTANRSLVDAGNNVMVAGIAFQVIIMVVCGGLAVDYVFRRYQKAQSRIVPGKNVFFARKETIFIGFVAFVYVTILTRCIYRIPELAGGWGGPRMRSEGEFLALDGLMIALGAIALTVAHPGYFFPPMRSYTANNRDVSYSSMSTVLMPSKS